MTLPLSGPLSLSQVETELLGSSPSQLNFNNQSFRLLASLGNNDAVIPSNSTVKWSDLYGKGVKRVVNSGTAANYNLYNNSTGAGYRAGYTLVIFTNNGTLGGSTASNYALTVASFTSGDKVQIVNNGYIVGHGGQGGAGGGAIRISGVGCPGYGQDSGYSGSSGSSGGPAINVTFQKVYIDNTNGTIGGGGDGGSGGNGYTNASFAYGGGGGGGGAGYSSAGGGGGHAILRYKDGLGNCVDGTASDGGTGNGGTITAPGTGSPSNTQGSTGSGLGSASALVGKANVNSGAGITTGTVYGAQG